MPTTLLKTAVSIIAFCAAALHAFGQSQTRHVLFIGNSYIYTNDIPQMLANAALSTGDTLDFDSHTPGGYTFWDHYNDQVTIDKIETGGWDFVVLQEQSQLPSWDSYDLFYAEYFSNKVRQHNPCARPLFYMTWGRQNGDAANCDMFPWVCTYEGMDSMLALRYMEMAQSGEAEVSPVGKVWKYVRQNYPSINLYQSDGSHPSVAGSYLVACCFYTSIFKKNPEVITFSSTVNASDAAIIRQATKIILFDSLSNYNFTSTNPFADFSFVVGSGTNELVFTNNSVNADFYLWDFGDGTTSTEENPTHNYATDGNYTITLTATNCDLDSSYQATQQASFTFCAHTPTIYPESLILCPNAEDTLWTQPADAYQWYNTNGDAISGSTNQHFVPQPGLSYSVVTTENGCSEMSQQVFVSSAASTFFYVTGVGNSGTVGYACIGDTAFLSIATLDPGITNLDPFVNWYVDSVLIPTPPNDSLMITESGLYGVTVEHPNCPGFVAAQYLNIDFQFIDCSTAVEEHPFASLVKMFPNPASENVILVNETNNELEFSIVDATGRVTIDATLQKGENAIWINTLANGIYTVRFNVAGLKPLKLIKL